jgi:hypothetical protein
MKGAYHKKRQELIRKADELDKKAEVQLLSQQGGMKAKYYKNLPISLNRKWASITKRAKTTEILQRDIK